MNKLAKEDEIIWILNYLSTIKTSKIIDNQSNRDEISAILQDFSQISDFSPLNSSQDNETQEDEAWNIIEACKNLKDFLNQRNKVVEKLEELKEYINDNITYDYINNLLTRTKIIEEIRDIENFLSFIDDIQKAETNTYILAGATKKAIVKIKLFKTFVDCNIHKLAKLISLNITQFTQNLDNKENTNKASNPNDPPSQIAFNFTNNEIDSEIEVLQTLCKFMALQISSYPSVNKFFRDFYLEHATISTTLTDKGEIDIDVMHPNFRVKRIKNKPIKELLSDDLFINIIQAEANKLITFNIDILDEDRNTIYEHFKLIFLNSNEDKIFNEKLNREWNIVREEAIRIMIEECMLTKISVDIAKYLRNKAEEHVIQNSKEVFKKLIWTKPLTNEFNNVMSVLSIIYDNLNNSVNNINIIKQLILI